MAPVPPFQRTLAFAAMGALLLGLTWLVAPEPVGCASSCLVVHQNRTGDDVYSRSMADGERFEITHVHSVSKRPVTVVYSAQAEAGIAMEEMHFDSFGANLPVGPEQLDADHATEFEVTADGYRVDHGSWLLPTLSLIVGSQAADHTVTFVDGERLRLLDLTPPHSSVEFRFS